MNKNIVYAAVVVICLGVGALISGLAVHFAESKDCPLTPQSRSVDCLMGAHNGGLTISGRLHITETTNSNVTITGTITGLPIGLHGFHIHQYGISGVDCVTAGGHWNPHNMKHGRPSDKERHVGDLGNLNVTSLTGITLQITDRLATLFGEDSMIGRALVIHENVDDWSQPTGNAGSRLACCTIMHLRGNQ